MDADAGHEGMFRMTLFKDIFVASGNGVGGGSLGDANTLYRSTRLPPRTLSGRTLPTGTPSWPLITTRPSTCLALSNTTTRLRPIVCSRSTRRRRGDR
jgi:hypothetical protein